MHLEALGEGDREPTSVTIERTSSSACDSRTSASRWMATDRCAGEKRDQGPSSKASRAARMARPVWASSAPGTDTMSSSVAGLKTCRAHLCRLSNTADRELELADERSYRGRFRHHHATSSSRIYAYDTRRRARLVARVAVVMRRERCGRRAVVDGDREAIEALVYGYAAAIDAGDLETFGSLFADATMAIAGSRRSAWRRGGSRLVTRGLHWYDGTPRTRHITTNLVVALGPDGDRAMRRARGRAPGARRLPLQVILVAHYDDEFERSGRMALRPARVDLRPPGRPLEALHQAGPDSVGSAGAKARGRPARR